MDLKKIDPGCIVLAELYTRCLDAGLIPTQWKESTTVLTYKDGIRQDPKNWRPLALGNCVSKLYSAILADRITNWAKKSHRLSKEQKGFLNDEGCLQHNFLLQTAIDDCRRSNKQLWVAWLDLSNPFGSVTHTHIFDVLREMDLPASMIKAVQNMYDGANTRIMTPEGPTDPIQIERGVRQGCPLSPILFNLAIEPLLRAIHVSRKTTGYKLAKGPYVQLLAYTDDICILTKDEHWMQSVLDATDVAANWCGLKFKPAKCATLHVDCRSGRRTMDTEFNIQDGSPKILQEGDAYKHLGVPTGFRVDQTPTITIQNIEYDIEKINRSLLAPWQKMDTIKTFIMPRLDFIARGGYITKTSLTNTDKLLKKHCKEWMNLPKRASAEMVYLAPAQGGAGILPTKDTTNVAAIIQAYRMIAAKDPFVSQVALVTLAQVVRRKIGMMPSEDDVCSFLNGEKEGLFQRQSGDIRSLWTRARTSTTELAKVNKMKWQWNSTRKEYEIVIPTPRDHHGESPPNGRQSHLWCTKTVT